MTYTLILSERAVTELTGAWEWYEDRQDGLGDRFKQNVYKQFAAIISNPQKGMKRKGDFYESIVKGFPYLVIYKVNNKSKYVFISSVFHTSRNPKKKYK